MIRATLTKIQNHSAERRAAIEWIGEGSVRERTTFQAGPKTKNGPLDRFISTYVDLAMSPMRSAAVFKLLADPTRLRLLRVLSHERFNVGELTSILGVAQSGV